MPRRLRKHEDCKAPPAQVLLLTNVLVGGDHRVKGCCGHPQQITILQFRPTHLSARLHFVSCQGAPQRSGSALVEEDSHPAATCPLIPKGVLVWFAKKASTSSTLERSISNQSETSSRLAPDLRFSRTTHRGRRVPRNNQTPLTLPGIRSSTGHFERSITIPVYSRPCSFRKGASIEGVSCLPLPQPFQGWNRRHRCPRVARSSQPWALLRNPFGILIYGDTDA